jgi:F420-0:gamma-glutamyl ligase-like protein
MLQPNQEKKRVITVDGSDYQRLPIRTHIITETDAIADIAKQYAKQHLVKGDILFVSEKAVACAQKRAIPISEIHPRRLAIILCGFVYKSPYGIGLSIPQTMEMALRECGTIRILFAAFIAIIGKLVGKKGWFYKIAGYKAGAIDGPTSYTLPPYDKCVVLAPKNPDKTATEISEKLGCPVCIVDINDLGGSILGISHPNTDKGLLMKVLKDNPLGQSSQQTPMGIIRCIVRTDAFKYASEVLIFGAAYK